MNVQPTQFSHPDYCILQFARSPVGAQVKTRLASVLDAQGRLELHSAMLERVALQSVRAGVCPVQLWVDGSVDHPLLQRLFRDHSIGLHVQQGADLGQRMANAARGAAGRYAGIILVGSDCPFLDGDYLRQAVQALDSGDAVLGPAADGGYVLLGLRAVHSDLFDRMPWGTDRVFAITRARIRALGWSCSLLPTLPDIDRPEDLPLLGHRSFPPSLRRFGDRS
ncbi:TIGR04282 family arsenosugar biosynthesis glycosyltransferase [Gilvimarinus sp. F26214L]|uniref:TIGR04282 family arsenosugar biosynthesis glycosyltransferase n=1 Tax=Gilvimarinus sp. DZF01 TaxID=3461371 RepID=UPI004045521B